MMPKGVDHSSPSGGTDCVCGVQKSLMPKGVDHMKKGRGKCSLAIVQKSLMPKGVDHLSARPELPGFFLCKNL